MISRSALVRLLITLSVVGLLAASCGDDDGDAGDEDEPTTTANEEVEDADGADDVFDRDACALLSDDEVAEVLGDDFVSEATPGDATIFQPAGCTWSTEAAIDLGDPQPTGITVFLGDRQIYDNTRVLAESGQHFEELDGIGDEAYAGGGEGGVVIGDVGITVSPLGTDTNASETQELVVELVELLAANA